MYFTAGYGQFSFISEYVQALEEFSINEIMFKDGGAQPKAWNTEVAYSMELFGHETVIAMAYEGTKEAAQLGLPQERYMGSASLGLTKGTVITLEYYRDTDYSLAVGGTDETADVLTGQLSYNF